FSGRIPIVFAVLTDASLGLSLQAIKNTGIIKINKKVWWFAFIGFLLVFPAPTYYKKLLFWWKPHDHGIRSQTGFYNADHLQFIHINHMHTVRILRLSYSHLF